MVDVPSLHIGENSPEQVALKLLEKVNLAEEHPERDRDEILDLYAECLLAVRKPEDRVSPKKKAKWRRVR